MQSLNLLRLPRILHLFYFQVGVRHMAGWRSPRGRGERWVVRVCRARVDRQGQGVWLGRQFRPGIPARRLARLELQAAPLAHTPREWGNAQMRATPRWSGEHWDRLIILGSSELDVRRGSSGDRGDNGGYSHLLRAAMFVEVRDCKPRESILYCHHDVPSSASARSTDRS